MKEHVLIVGAGLCGTLLGIRLAQRGYRVSLVERRADMRQAEVDSGRSINLALSDRGWKALRLVGLEDEMRAQVIPMYGRYIHAIGEAPWLSRYSGREHEFINSVSRAGLNIALLNAADGQEHLSLRFGLKCTGVDLDSVKAQFASPDGAVTEVEADIIIGTDGAGSAVRRSIFGRSAELRFDYTQDFLDHGYKELSIPPTGGGKWRIEKNALHIWPRQNFMLIALPNLDGSFTVTLFLPFDGDPGYHQLTDEKAVQAFFEEVFPTAVEHMPDLGKDYFDNPTGTLGTIKCYPWQVGGRILLMGDAAHAIVPFYGQGMNCALEDVVVLDGMLDEHDGDWERTLVRYQEVRRPDTDAIADLAVENYFEMRDHVDNPDFRLKRQLETQLEKRYPEYSSKYNLVTFNEDLPYARAKAQGHRQDEVLLRFCREHADDTNIDLEEVYALVRS